MDDLYQGCDDYGQQGEDEIEDVKDGACDIVERSPSSGQVVHCEVDTFMMVL